MEMNFMGMPNFMLSPLERMKMVWSSGILGEPQFYHSEKDIYIRALRDSLDFDYKATLDFADELRNDLNMRKGPQIIIVEAVLHQKRIIFNKTYPRYFRDVCKKVIRLPSEIRIQFEYYKESHNSKSKLPGILKKCWKEALERFPRYQLNKYKNKGKIVDMIRICHPRSRKNEFLKDLVYSSVDKEENKNTWEQLRSEGKSWGEIIKIINPFPHMALLRNINAIAGDIQREELSRVLENLEKGVGDGKQFPFRYYSAYQKATNDEVKASLEKCVKLSVNNLPVIKGRIISLCDNSGSAWGAFTSRYGTQTIATIGNLSGLIAAMCATEESYVGIFGDNLIMYKVDKSRGIFEQLEEIDQLGQNIGASTENGIWIFFNDSFKQKIDTFDHLFIYSDMQAGRGELYGSDPSEYADYVVGGKNINVMDLINTYRNTINNHLNVFTVQTGAYDNSLIPEYFYRGAILSGWTGNEILFANKLISIWDEAD